MKTGDYVAAIGQLQSDGTLLASQVNVGLQPGLGFGRGGMMGEFGEDGNKVAGQITAVVDSKITIQAGGTTTQTVTIVTDANTKFYMAGGAAGTLADVKTGEYLLALVQKQSDGTLLASQVMVGTQPGMGFGHGMMGEFGFSGIRVGGQVTAVDGTKITVQVGQSTQVILTDSNTRFYLAGSAAGALADVKTGEYVMALAQKQSDGSLLATQIMVGSNAGQGAGPMWNFDRQHRQGPGFGPGNRQRPVAPGTNS